MSGGSAWLSLLWVALCVVGILALAYWFTRYVASRGVPGGEGGQETERFQVLARLALGREQSLAVVQAGQRCFLLGVTPAGISNLAEFSGEEAEGWLKDGKARPAPPGFREALHMVIEQRKQR